MPDEPRVPDEPMSDAAPTELAARGTALSLALGFETLTDRACGMRAPFRADLVGDPAGGAIATGVIFALPNPAFQPGSAAKSGEANSRPSTARRKRVMEVAGEVVWW